jgi:xanthine/CO dehydrogenase XdhC/CoxF family maturation factor
MRESDAIGMMEEEGAERNTLPGGTLENRWSERQRDVAKSQNTLFARQ